MNKAKTIKFINILIRVISLALWLAMLTFPWWGSKFIFT
jgi:hypothetical protein